MTGGPWICEANDAGGIFVYFSEDPGETAPIGHPTELAAWEHGLDCLMDRRDAVRDSIKDARAEVAPPEEEENMKAPFSGRAPWGHVSRHCARCGKVGPRCMVADGWAHFYCLTTAEKKERRK